MKVSKKVTTTIDTVNEWNGRIFSWLIIPLVLITVMEVICRRFLGSPTIWSFEVLKQIYAFHFMIVAAYGLLHKSHVAIDVFTMNLSEKKQAILDIVTYLIFFMPFSIICVWESYLFAAESWAVGERTWSVFAPIIYPIKTVVVITFILLFLQGISEIIKRVLILKGETI